MSIASVIAIICAALSACTFLFFIFFYFTNLIQKKCNVKPQTMSLDSVAQPYAALASMSSPHIVTRMFWPTIVSLSQVVLPFMTWGWRQRLTHALSQAGWIGWNCAQFLAMQVLCAACGAIVSLFLFIVLSDMHSNEIALFDLLALCTGGGLLTGILPRLRLRTHKRTRYAEIECALPFFLDIVTLGLDAGMNLQTAVQMAIDHLEAGPLKYEWIRTIFDIRSGVSRADAFRNLSLRVELSCIKQMVAAFIQSESMGLSLAKSIAEFSRQQGQYRLLQME